MDGEIFRGLAVLSDAIALAGQRTAGDPETDARVARLLDENQATIRALIRYAASAIARR